MPSTVATVIGCSGTAAGPHAPGSCYLIESGDASVLIDVGPGSLAGVVERINWHRLSAIIVTHLHADHCSDLVGLSYARANTLCWPFPQPGDEFPPIRVIAPAGARDRVARLYHQPAYDWLDRSFTFETLTPGPIAVDGITMCAFPVLHPIETYGIRVSGSHGDLVYTADTAYSDDLVTSVAGAAVLLCEATLLSGHWAPPDTHMTGAEAGVLAQRASAGALVLTHIPPWLDRRAVADEARRAFTGPLLTASPAMTFTI